MEQRRDRPGRKDRAGSTRASRKRSQRSGRLLAALATACAAAGLSGVQAQAVTGGASTLASTQATAGDGVAFTPMRSAGATWYGPGLYGNQTACGQVLRPGTIGVAHRSLPCGTAVKFDYRGRQLVTRVIDRGPFADGYAWDLTNGARKTLGFDGSDRILYAVALG